MSKTTKVEEAVVEKGGYAAGNMTVSELPPPPPSVTVCASDGDQATAVERAHVRHYNGPGNGIIAPSEARQQERTDFDS